MRFTNTRYNNPIHEGGVFMATLLFGDSIAKGITYDDSKLSVASETLLLIKLKNALRLRFLTILSMDKQSKDCMKKI